MSTVSGYSNRLVTLSVEFKLYEVGNINIVKNLLVSSQGLYLSVGFFFQIVHWLTIFLICK